MKKKVTKKKIRDEYYKLKPDILIIDNMRHIKPYEFKYQGYAKERWVDRKLIDVLVKEFKHYSEEQIIESFKNGDVTLNNKQAKPDDIVKRSDFISHLVIRRESPIINKKLDFIFEDDKYLVVDKPPSWPIHVCGGYQFNTLHRILMDDYKKEGLYTVHRLDRQTSGIVIFAKTKQSLDDFNNNLNSKNVEKVYFCRVKGKFNHDSIVCKRGIFIDKNKGILTDCEFVGEEIQENSDSENEKSKFQKPIDTKYAETLFEMQFYDESSNTSVLLAKPKTGRTHQIRIHLRYLGFPIANDPCYGGVLYNDLKEYNILDPSSLEQNPFLVDNSSSNNEQLSFSEIFCYRIWLHAWNYRFGSYEFKTTPPEWANSEYKLDKTF